MSAFEVRSLRPLLRTARQRRAPLEQDPATTAYRWLNALADGVPEVTIDRHGEVAVISLYREFSAAEEGALVEAAVAELDPSSVYQKRRPREARVVANTKKDELAPETPAQGPAVDALEVLEGGLRYRIRPGQGLSVGLYLDMRDTRTWLRRTVGARTVLNCFAYTCAFGVAAAAGGSSRAVNVDLSRRVLDWGAENAQLNGQPAPAADYLSGDVFEWLKRLGKKGEQFDFAILDPPSFSTSKAGRFSAARDYPALVAQAAPLVSNGGVLLACCNLAQLSAARFEGQVREGLATAGRRGQVTERLGPSPVDFPSTPKAPAALKVLAVEVA